MERMRIKKHSVTGTLYKVQGIWYMIPDMCKYSGSTRFKAWLASGHPNVVHQYVPPLPPQLFRPQASGATAPKCRACSASRENRVGLTTHSLTATNRSGVYIYIYRSVQGASPAAWKAAGRRLTYAQNVSDGVVKDGNKT